jgi:hypothetical protein
MVYGGKNMKTQYGKILAICLIATFFVGIAFGATDYSNVSTTNVTKTNVSTTNVTKTNVTGSNVTDSVQPVNTTIKPADTTVRPVNTIEPVTPVRTTIQPTVPATPKPSPGFGIVVTAIIISILYVYGKRR